MNKVIVLDPGHGGDGTVGGSRSNVAVSPSGVLEKTMTLDFARRVRDRLDALTKELTVLLTREKDENLGLKARARFAASNGADLFLSIHFNASDEGRGVEAWVRGVDRGNQNHPADSAYARRIKDSVLKALRTYAPDTPDRGVKDDDARELGLGVLKPAWLGNVAGESPRCRACLVLVEFISDPEVDRLLNTGDRFEDVRNSIAASLANALLEELGLKISMPAGPSKPVEPVKPVEPDLITPAFAEPPTISGPVGRVEKNAVNNAADVRTVQQLLRLAAERLGNPACNPGDVTGNIAAGDEDPTVKAIEAFQERYMRNPDGLIDVDGRTWKLLFGALGINVPTEGFCFPFSTLPKEDWMSGPRRFGSNRAGGRRAHAGCDLYADEGTIIHAIGDGEVVEGPYSFYLGTYAIEIDHGKFLARYGEVQGDAFVSKGDTVKMGDQIARVGNLRGLDLSMLHFELYDKSAKGPLTVKGRASKRRQDDVPFVRRRDLIDPTLYLNAWQYLLPTEENLEDRPARPAETAISRDESLSLPRFSVRFYKGEYRERQEAANADDCVCYVEQHFNSASRSSADYSLALVASNASRTSKEWGRAYAKAVAREFSGRTGGDDGDGLSVVGPEDRGYSNLRHTNMPAILLEPLFASNPGQADIIRSDAGQARLARVLVETIRQFFPQGGLIGFSVGHKYKRSKPDDRGAELFGGGFEAEFAELVLLKAEKLLTAGRDEQTEPSGVQQEFAAQLRVPTAARTFSACKQKVKDRRDVPDSFLNELVDWGRQAPDEIFQGPDGVFAKGKEHDIYISVRDKLGPWEGPLHRKAVMLEVLRVLAGFESSWNWNEDIDKTRKSADTAQNSEAGAWQVSADSLAFGQDLKDLVNREVGTLDGVEFQRAMKENHPLAMEYCARLMRHTTRHNGPLYKDRDKQSIYPWLSPGAVAEFQKFLA